MVSVTPDILQQIARCHDSVARQFATPLTVSMRRFDISTPVRAATFLAQAAFESSNFSRLAENMNYSEAAILRTFPTHISPIEVPVLAHHPEKIANRVYANRMGNGPEATSDGWRFIGRGLFGITGRYEYERCAAALGAPLAEHPEWLEWPSWACRSAAWFWHDRGLNTLADAGHFEEITRRINGGLNGETDRLVYLARAKAALNIK